MAKIKASDLKQGDVIRTECWSNLWKRLVPTPCTVMDVTVLPGGNLNIMAKAADGLKEYVTTIFTPSTAEFIPV